MAPEKGMRQIAQGRADQAPGFSDRRKCSAAICPTSAALYGFISRGTSANRSGSISPAYPVARIVWLSPACRRGRSRLRRAGEACVTGPGRPAAHPQPRESPALPAASSCPLPDSSYRDGKLDLALNAFGMEQQTRAPAQQGHRHGLGDTGWTFELADVRPALPPSHPRSPAESTACDRRGGRSAP